MAINLNFPVELTEGEITRFWSKVDKNKDCWLWTDHRDASGYGSYHVNKTTVKSHQLSWWLINSELISKEFTLKHKCGNLHCVNVSCMEMVPISASLPNEQWVACFGYEELYEVSNLGRVRSIPRLGTAGGIRKVEMNPCGYFSLRLFKDGTKTRKNIHSLVVRSFRGPPTEKGLECRHLNGDPLDNRLENLVWGTSAENSADMVAHGRTNSRITHCPQGHEYDSINTYIYDGRRYCRTCNKLRKAGFL